MVSRDEIRRIVLELIRTDEEFRLAIAGALELDTILNELRALRQDFNALLSRAVSIEETLKRDMRSYCGNIARFSRSIPGYCRITIGC